MSKERPPLSRPTPIGEEPVLPIVVEPAREAVIISLLDETIARLQDVIRILKEGLDAKN